LFWPEAIAGTDVQEKPINGLSFIYANLARGNQWSVPLVNLKAGIIFSGGTLAIAEEGNSREIDSQVT